MVSVIIPTLNEAETLRATLNAVAASADGAPFEVIVADGGSTDGTLDVARVCGCKSIAVPRAQRAGQMNAGAGRAKGTILLFLHADTLLPPGALPAVIAACARSGVVGGGFARRYASRSRWLRLTCGLAVWRNRWIGWHLGDQAIFVRRDAYERVGGFREMDIFEDVDFSRRLARVGILDTLRPPVISSARRFGKRGPFRTSLADVWLTMRYLWREPAVRPRSSGGNYRATAPISSTP